MSNTLGPRQLFRGSLIFHGSMGLIAIIGIWVILDISEFVRPVGEKTNRFFTQWCTRNNFR